MASARCLSHVTASIQFMAVILPYTTRRSRYWRVALNAATSSGVPTAVPVAPSAMRLSRPVSTLLGLSLPEDGYHGPNESFAWGQAEGGMLTFVRYFERACALARKG